MFKNGNYSLEGQSLPVKSGLAQTQIRVRLLSQCLDQTQIKLIL